MWTVFEETQNEGRIRGIIEMGIECGLSEELPQNKITIYIDKL